MVPHGPIDTALLHELTLARDRLARAAGAVEQADRTVESARAAARRAHETEDELRTLVARLEAELTGHGDGDRPLFAAANGDPPADPETPGSAVGLSGVSRELARRREDRARGLRKIRSSGAAAIAELDAARDQLAGRNGEARGDPAPPNRAPIMRENMYDDDAAPPAEWAGTREAALEELLEAESDADEAADLDHEIEIERPGACSFDVELRVGASILSVRVKYDGERNPYHLEFHGPVSETGFRSHFSYGEPGDDIREFARGMARHLARLEGHDVDDTPGAPAWRALPIGRLEGHLAERERRALVKAGLIDLGDVDDEDRYFGGGEVTGPSPKRRQISRAAWERAVWALRAFLVAETASASRRDPPADPVPQARETAAAVEMPSAPGAYGPSVVAPAGGWDHDSLIAAAHEELKCSIIHLMICRGCRAARAMGGGPDRGSPACPRCRSQFWSPCGFDDHMAVVRDPAPPNRKSRNSENSRISARPSRKSDGEQLPPAVTAQGKILRDELIAAGYRECSRAQYRAADPADRHERYRAVRTGDPVDMAEWRSEDLRRCLKAALTAWFVVGAKPTPIDKVKASGATNEQILAALCEAWPTSRLFIGADQIAGSDYGCTIASGGNFPVFWMGAFRGPGQKATLSGDALADRVRDVLSIPMPSPARAGFDLVTSRPGSNPGANGVDVPEKSPAPAAPPKRGRRRKEAARA